MKKILLILALGLALVLSSCTKESLYPEMNQEIPQDECGTVKIVELKPDGYFYVYIQFNENANFVKYQVNSQDKYYKNQLVCDFSALTKM